MSRMWGGRFGGQPDPDFERFQRSLPFDVRLLEQDLRGSVAWARALTAAGVLGKGEGRRLVAALGRIGRSLGEDSRPLLRSRAEDVHTFVEQALEREVGELAKKLHTGRSRNDQVATDLKLWLFDACADLDARIERLQRALVGLAERTADLPMPGFTHLQRAQPITAGHHALAYVEMLSRDRSRLADGLARMGTCPLGSGALAGSAVAVDRRAIARELLFAGGPARNSLDAVSDRDHVCELLFCGSMLMTHLSRLAEDWIFFASQEAGYLALGERVTTGSSLMPQKQNPDLLELLRGKTGRVIGHLQAMLITLKGLPLAYDKDLQEDKEGLFDALDTVFACVEMATLAVRHARYRRTRCRQESQRGYLNATDLADLLVEQGVPFRDAHRRSGEVVRRAIEQGVEVEELAQSDRQELLPELRVDLKKALSVERVLARRSAIGGTAPTRVRAEVRRWRRLLGMTSAPRGS